jgi:hypothetical protein
MKFFNLDLHISVIKDIEKILHKIYGNTIEIVNWSLSEHNWVFKQDKTNVDIINENTWDNINEELIREFNDKYDFSNYDGFIVTHTPVFSMIFEKYNKPIICINSCRYDMPFCLGVNPNIEWFHEGLKRMCEKGQLIIVSNNLGDQEYLYRGTGITSHYIPSLCCYTNTQYMPRLNKFVIYGDHGLYLGLKNVVKRPSPGYSWDLLYSFKGIIHNPYEISTMSIAEQITAGVPLFFPTKRFYLDCITNGLMKLISNYDGKNRLSLEEWIDRGDFYNSYKYIHYYDSLEDLAQKLRDFNKIEDECRDNRLVWLVEREKEILSKWKVIFDKIIQINNEHPVNDSI